MRAGSAADVQVVGPVGGVERHEHGAGGVEARGLAQLQQVLRLQPVLHVALRVVPPPEPLVAAHHRVRHVLGDQSRSFYSKRVGRSVWSLFEFAAWNGEETGSRELVKLVQSERLAFEDPVFVLVRLS